MSNPHIELFKKFLDDPKSVSAEELKRAAAAATADAAAYFTAVAYFTAAAAADADTFVADAKFLIEKYEELTK